MDFQLVFEKVISSFEKENLQYGLIGGFALGVMGILRATMDVDILLLVDDLDKADKILTGCMYSCIHRSPHLSQYTSELKALGSIDILHASKTISKEMLSRVERFRVFNKYMIPVLSPEDIIGLKVQAIANDRQREAIDINDMRLLLEYQLQRKRRIDWELLEDYFSLFNKQALLTTLKKDFS
ncbi:MAG: nucleotidyl transferase AbiEii/AbiGii toxin family protein [Desulforhopalus sp.]